MRIKGIQNTGYKEVTPETEACMIARDHDLWKGYSIPKKTGRGKIYSRAVHSHGYPGFRLG